MEVIDHQPGALLHGDEPDAAVRAARDGLVAELDGAWPPPGLVEDTAPGPVLAAVLNMVFLAQQGPEVLVEVAAGAARLASWAAAREAAATAELTARAATWRGVGPGANQVLPEAAAAAEVGAALVLSPGAARIRVELAQSLARLPLTRLALAAGRVDLTKARAVVEAVAGLPDEVAAAVEARVIARAPAQTAAALRGCLRRAVISLDPAGAAARQDTKVAQRGVWRQVLSDGMARLEWVGPIEQVEATHSWITGGACQILCVRA